MRTVDADEIRKKAVPHTRGNYGYSADIRKWAVLVGDIDDAPTIDAVPVVRCRDCLYWQDNNGGYPHEECRWGKDETPDPDDFCSCGERKDGDTDG